MRSDIVSTIQIKVMAAQTPGPGCRRPGQVRTTVVNVAKGAYAS